MNSKYSAFFIVLIFGAAAIVGVLFTYRSEKTNLEKREREKILKQIKLIEEKRNFLRDKEEEQQETIDIENIMKNSDKGTSPSLNFDNNSISPQQTNINDARTS